MRLPLLVCAVVVSLLILPSAFAAIPLASCNFTLFDAPAGYTISQVNGIDDNGMVVGELQDIKTGDFVAFVRSATGKFTVYTAPKSMMNWFNSRSSAVNVGTYEDTGFHMHGMAVNGSNFVAISYPKSAHTWVNGINATGTVVGSYLSGTTHKGFRLQGGTYKAIAHSGALLTSAQAINDSGAIAGYYADSTGKDHGFVWQNGVFSQIVDYPNAKYGTQLTGINKGGVIVGNYLSGDFAFGIFYKKNAFSRVVYSGAKAASVGGINTGGEIAGRIVFTLKDTPGYTATCK